MSEFFVMINIFIYPISLFLESCKLVRNSKRPQIIIRVDNAVFYISTNPFSGENLEYKFALLETSPEGHIAAVDDLRTGDYFHPLTLFPAGLPPVFKPLTEEVAEKFLEHPERLGIHDFRKSQRFDTVVL